MPSDYTFEWDEAKRHENLAKHGIDFRDIPRLFEWPYMEDFDAEHSSSEDRWRIIGLLYRNVVFCVYTIIGENRRRIISARPATKQERGVYFRRFWFDPFPE